LAEKCKPLVRTIGVALLALVTVLSYAKAGLGENMTIGFFISYK